MLSVVVFGMKMLQSIAREKKNLLVEINQIIYLGNSVVIKIQT